MSKLVTSLSRIDMMSDIVKSCMSDDSWRFEFPRKISEMSFNTDGGQPKQRDYLK